MTTNNLSLSVLKKSHGRRVVCEIDGVPYKGKIKILTWGNIDLSDENTQTSIADLTMLLKQKRVTNLRFADEENHLTTTLQPKKEGLQPKIDWEKRWKKIVKANFGDLEGNSLSKSELECKIEAVGLIFISQEIEEAKKSEREKIENDYILIKKGEPHDTSNYFKDQS